VIQEKGLYVYNLYNTVEKHYNFRNAPVRSKNGLLINNFFFFHVTHIHKKVGIVIFIIKLFIALLKTQHKLQARSVAIMGLSQ
jgi:hypothetical protein